jgi:hypothetical protein
MVLAGVVGCVCLGYANLTTRSLKSTEIYLGIILDAPERN